MASADPPPTDRPPSDRAAAARPLSPHLQIYRFQWTMALSILHRITGVALTAGALGLVWWLLALSGSVEEHGRFVDAAGSPFGLVVVALFLAALVYHFFNGIRHLLWDTGWGLDIPTAFRTGMAVIVLSVASLALLLFVLWRGLS